MQLGFFHIGGRTGALRTVRALTAGLLASVTLLEAACSPTFSRNDPTASHNDPAARSVPAASASSAAPAAPVSFPGVSAAPVIAATAPEVAITLDPLPLDPQSSAPVIEQAPMAPEVAPAAPAALVTPAAAPIAPAALVTPATGPTVRPFRPFRPKVERWRGLVRELLHEARLEGRFGGAAWRLDENLVLAVMEQESGGDPEAESWAGARGLMQLMPESFAWIMGIRNWGEDISDIDPTFVFDPTTNVRAGVRMLSAVLEEQGGSVYWALASYNAGGGAVNRWRAMGYDSVPDWYGFGETANYVPAILGSFNAHTGQGY